MHRPPPGPRRPAPNLCRPGTVWIEEPRTSATDADLGLRLVVRTVLNPDALAIGGWRLGLAADHQRGVQAPYLCRQVVRFDVGYPLIHLRFLSAIYAASLRPAQAGNIDRT